MNLDEHAKYRLLLRLGRGGMAEVHIAVARGPAGFNKLVVVKRLLPALASDEGFREMFMQEARLAARLNHPNIVQTYEVGDAPDGKGYNPPSLLGIQVGAPFFHAGQVRTLEDLLSNTFAAHREALTGGFLAEGSPGREAKLTALVAYLLSIDEEAAPIEIPSLGPGGGDFCKVF